MVVCAGEPLQLQPTECESQAQMLENMGTKLKQLSVPRVNRLVIPATILTQFCALSKLDAMFIFY